jgi:hypothetical protein
MFVEQVAYYFQILRIRQCLFVIGKLDYMLYPGNTIW